MPVKLRGPLIVGVGASAGGLEALKLFFSGVNGPTGVAFVVVTHQDPGHRSELVDILARHTALPVSSAEAGVEPQADRVYVAPPGVILTIVDGRLVATVVTSVQARARAIDAFFSSLAYDQGENAAGVVLSGLDGDGTLGIKAIKERNGLTLAQTDGGSSPGFDSMPQSAIATGLVDLPVSADEMVPRLVQFARGMGFLGNRGTDAQIRIEVDDILGHKGEICAILLERVGHDFAGYKDQTFARRVLRRCVFLNVASVADYITALRSDIFEATALFRDLLINVTDFFRDADAFETLARDVIPALLEGRTSKDTVRVWVPGCATGEEVFSLAILLKEATDGLDSPPHIQIFATDIDERALDVARAGRFPAPMMKGVSEERRRRFFVQDGTSFTVDRAVRELCIFSAHSVFRDPPFSRVDLVSCRNLLIYLGADVQDQVLPIFHYALRAQGYLFLGLSESIGRHAGLFEPVDRKNRVFRAKGAMQAMPRLPFALDRDPGYPAVAPRQLGASRLRREAEAQVLERHAPQFVIVNMAGTVVYFSAATGAFLQPAPGLPSRALTDLVRKGARLEVRSALREAMETGRMARRNGLVVDAGQGRSQTFDLAVEPLDKREGEDALMLVVFAEVAARSGDGFQVKATQGGHDVDLEAETRDLRERLQASGEEYETAMEELRSSNEELMSLNEEYQSTNEELEASREELQSLNEELQTVNGELKVNIAELDATAEDLRHFFESTDVATVFLDGALTIRNYTPTALDIFRIQPGDKGRALTDLSMSLNHPSFEHDLRRCLHENMPVEAEVLSHDEKTCYLLKIRPFAKLRGGEKGLIVTASDVTDIARLRLELSRLGGGIPD